MRGHLRGLEEQINLLILWKDEDESRDEPRREEKGDAVLIAVVLKKGDPLNATKDVPAEQTNETLAEDVAATRKERGW